MCRPTPAPSRARRRTTAGQGTVGKVRQPLPRKPTGLPSEDHHWTTCQNRTLRGPDGPRGWHRIAQIAHKGLSQPRTLPAWSVPPTWRRSCRYSELRGPPHRGTGWTGGRQKRRITERGKQCRHIRYLATSNLGNRAKGQGNGRRNWHVETDQPLQAFRTPSVHRRRHRGSGGNKRDVLITPRLLHCGILSTAPYGVRWAGGNCRAGCQPSIRVRSATARQVVRIRDSKFKRLRRRISLSALT